MAGVRGGEGGHTCSCSSVKFRPSRLGPSQVLFSIKTIDGNGRGAALPRSATPAALAEPVLPVDTVDAALGSTAARMKQPAAVIGASPAA